MDAVSLIVGVVILLCLVVFVCRLVGAKRGVMSIGFISVALTLTLLFTFGIVTAILYSHPHGLVADWAPSLCGVPSVSQ